MSLRQSEKVARSLVLVLIGGITLENAESLPGGEKIFYAVISDAFRDGATKGAVAKFAREFNSIVPAGVNDTRP